jgi:hypothetical protein
MPVETNLILLAGQRYALVADSQLPSGKRAWQREKRPSQPSDPSVQQTASWRLSGPIGLSREDVAGGPLAVDYTKNADTLYENLLLPGPARNEITLASATPISEVQAFYDTFLYDDGVPYDSGTSAYAAGGAKFVDEDRGALFFHDQAFSTQVEPVGMTATETIVHLAAVEGAAMWRNRGYLGLGQSALMQRRATVSLTQSTYEDVSTFYAGALVVGPDRLWMVDPEDPSEVALRYSLDALVTRSNPFPVGDPGIPATGLGTYGRSALAGSEIGAFGFNELGQPTRVVESLKGHRSNLNGVWVQTLWGWSYITTDIGLKATIPGQIENPAGPGADRRYEGPNGRISAIWPYKDALFAAALTADGDAYVYRGEFDDGRYGGSTQQNGRPAWFPFAYLEATEVGVIFSTALRPTPTLLVGENSQIASYWTLSVLDRDIDDPAYRFHTGASEWNGTTMMRNPGTHKNLRYFVAYAEDCDATNSYQVQVSVDGGAYVNIDDPITAGGHYFLRPSVAGVPLTTVNGHTYKPRIVGAHDNAVTPAKLRGTLDMVYDERPDTIIQHTFIVELGATRNTPNGAITDFDTLSDLYRAHGVGAASPLAFQLPGQTVTTYGFIVDYASITDLVGDGVQRATITVQEYAT